MILKSLGDWIIEHKKLVQRVGAVIMLVPIPMAFVALIGFDSERVGFALFSVSILGTQITFLPTLLRNGR